VVHCPSDINRTWHFGVFCGQLESSGGQITVDLHPFYKLQQTQINQDTWNNERVFKSDVQALVLHDFVAIQPDQLNIKKVIDISVC